MSDSLSSFYRWVQGEHLVSVDMPPAFGRGHIERLSLPSGISLSSWQMEYDQDMPVAGRAGEELRLLFCQGQGVSWEKSQGGKVSLDAGQVYLGFGEGKEERMCYEGGSSYAFQAVHVPRSVLYSLLSVYLPKEEIYGLVGAIDGRHLNPSPQVRRLLMGLSERSDGLLEGMRLEGQVQELLALCLQDALGTGEALERIRKEDRLLIETIRARIDENPASVPTASHLARDFAISQSKMTRLFKGMYGVSLHAYVVERRLQEAALLLEKGDYAIGEVAEMVGYKKASQFSAAFGKRFGVLPKDYTCVE